MAHTEENLPTRRDMQADLHAAVRARQELGLDMEDHVLDSFLSRLEQRVDAMVDTRLAQKGKVVPAKSARVAPPSTDVIVGSLGVSIPLLVIAAIFAHALGVALVMAGVVAVILLYFIDRWATN